MAVRLRFVLTVFAITGAVIAASVLITFWYGNRVLRAHGLEQSRREEIARLQELESLVKDAETGQRGYVITGDPAYLQPFEKASQRIPIQLNELGRPGAAKISSADFTTTKKLIDEKMAELETTIELRRKGGFEAALREIQKGSGKQLMDQLRSEIAQLREKQLAALHEAAALSDHTTRTRTGVFIICGLLNIGVLLWGYRRIADALRERDRALDDASRRRFELQEQKELLSVTLASIGDCVIVTDNKGIINFINPIAESVSGWSGKEALGRPIAEVFRILNEQTREPVESPVDRVIREGVIVGLANHTLLITKDGKEIPIDDNGAPIRDSSGNIRGVVLVFRDFSQHKLAEQELLAAKEAAETANKAKDQFLAMLSHELRTPLTPVLATLNLWEASEDIPRGIRPEVQMLRRNIELEARIIDDLLDLTRIARGLLSFSPETTDAHALIQFLVGLTQSEFHGKELDVTLQFSAARHYIFTDTGRLQQVLWNIMRNAVKFTEAGGSVTISTSNDSEDNIEIAITDTGIGMTPETISKLFLPFEQADPVSSRRYGGLGLGLSISHALVELLKGKLKAESPGLGKGSTFTLSFPTTEKPDDAGEESANKHGLPGKVRLLLVEDHLDTARALSRLLENRGYNVSSAGTVAAALETLARDEFDLLLCDLGLPDGTGIDLIKKIRRHSRTPAIALTGFGMQQDIERAEEAGFDAHLTKPVNLQVLEATIWRLLQE